MVTKSYMLDRPPPPSPAKVFVNQQAIPRLIDAAGGFETLLQRMSNGARRRPGVAVISAFGCGWVLRRVVQRRRRSGSAA